MSNITFLFGAGAEQGFGLSGGANFAINLLGVNEKNEKLSIMNEALELYYKERVEKIEWYPNYKPDVWTLDKLAEASLRKDYLENPDRLKGMNTKKSFDDLINEESKMFYSKKKLNRKKCIKQIEKTTSYMGILDGYFHTLISPVYLGPNNFWKVVNCYNRAYLLLINELTEDMDKSVTVDDYYHILKTPNETYHSILTYSKNKSEKDSYYKSIRNYLIETEVDHNIRVITANYTPLCEKIADIAPENIAYVHGKLGWFEIPDKLEVFDINDYDNERINLETDVFFPYIFIQSGIKPIVEEKQLREYSKMLSFLDKTDVLCILGYHINIDDNHLNSLIRSYILRGKEINYFDYKDMKDKSDNEKSEENILRKLKLTPSECKNNFNYISINESNCSEVFESTLKITR